MRPINAAQALICMSLLIVYGNAQQATETVKVISKPLERTVKLPGEFAPFLGVTVSAKVTAFVDNIAVDRGSVVSRGQLLATLVAPELSAQRSEADAKVQAAEAELIEAEAQLLAVQSTYERLKEASATEGAVAGNELLVKEKEVAAARALVEARRNSAMAAKSSAKATQELESYLKITASFDGLITERYVHPGALVGPTSGSAAQLFRLEQVSRLRLLVAVPEAQVGGIARGATVSLRVPAYPGEAFKGTVARLAGSLDPRTRTMPVEVDVQNPQRRLAPGMYPEVLWPVRNKKPSLMVPPSAIVTTTEKTFVIRVRSGKAEWVDVVRGTPAENNLLEVFGQLNPGDEIVLRGSDEIRPGSQLTLSATAPPPVARDR
jgi:membrane fusion protein, multidrug efflux system